MIIAILYTFQTAVCPSSGELIVSMQNLVYVTLCRWPSGMQVGILTCIPDGHLHRVPYTRCRIDTISSPDDGHTAVQKHVENSNNHIRKKTVHQVGLFPKMTQHIVQLSNYKYSVEMCTSSSFLPQRQRHKCLVSNYTLRMTVLPQFSLHPEDGDSKFLQNTHNNIHGITFQIATSLIFPSKNTACVKNVYTTKSEIQQFITQRHVTVLQWYLLRFVIWLLAEAV